MDTTLYDIKGKKIKSIALNESVFNVDWNESLVHQVAVSMLSNTRRGLAHTKDRSEIRGGGAKPWKQKGTGRARHGSSSSPIWRGGGVTFGPRNEKNYTKRINKKMRAQSLYVVLSKKLKEKQLVFVDKITFAEPKTKLAITFIEKIEGAFKDKRGKILLVLGENNKIVERCFSNIPKVEVVPISGLNTKSALSHTRIVISSPEIAEELLLARKNK